MKNYILFCTLLCLFIACKQTPKNNTATSKTPQANEDSIAVAATIHGFYTWYDALLRDSTRAIDFTFAKGNHLALDEKKLDAYLSNVMKSGFVTASFIENDKAFYRKCETYWQKEPNDGPPTGMDADKYFCAQDWDINFWIKSPVRLAPIGDNEVKATLYGMEGEYPEEHQFELKKEGGKWLLSKIKCDLLPEEEEEKKPVGHSSTQTIKKAKPAPKPKPTAAPVAPSIVVDRKGEITLMGKKVSLEGLRKALQGELVKKAIIPQDIPIKFDNEILMGMRGEVRTEVSDAIKGANWIRKKACLDALRVPIERDLKTAVQLQVEQYKTSGNFAFVSAIPRQPGGTPIDYSKTPFKMQVQEGAFDDGVFGLLKFEKGTWRVLKYTLGATDVPFVCWWKDYNTPKDLFDKEMLAKDCN